MDQRTIALIEQRERIKAKAMRMASVSFTSLNFHISVEIQVFHGELGMDLKQFKNWVETLFTTGTVTVENNSPEIISDNLYEIIANNYPNRNINIAISQDNDIGITINYNLTQPYQQLAI